MLPGVYIFIVLPVRKPPRRPLVFCSQMKCFEGGGKLPCCEDAMRVLFLSFFSSGHVEARKKGSRQEQHGHVRGAEGRSAGLLLTSTPRRVPKKQEKQRKKNSIKVRTVAPGRNTLHVQLLSNRLIGRPDQPRFQQAELHQNTLHVGPANSYCTIRLMSCLTNHGVNTLNSNAVKRGS